MSITLKVSYRWLLTFFTGQAYDYIITFGDEVNIKTTPSIRRWKTEVSPTTQVRLVWPAPWNIGKIMFFLTRYPIFADCALNLLGEWKLLPTRAFFYSFILVVLQPYLPFHVRWWFITLVLSLADPIPLSCVNLYTKQRHVSVQYIHRPEVLVNLSIQGCVSLASP